jgi:hypothetical protein
MPYGIFEAFFARFFVTRSQKLSILLWLTMETFGQNLIKKLNLTYLLKLNIFVLF